MQRLLFLSILFLSIALTGFAATSFPVEEANEGGSLRLLSDGSIKHPLRGELFLPESLYDLAERLAAEPVAARPADPMSIDAGSVEVEHDGSWMFRWLPPGSTAVTFVGPTFGESIELLAPPPGAAPPLDNFELQLSAGGAMPLVGRVFLREVGDAVFHVESVDLPEEDSEQATDKSSGWTRESIPCRRGGAYDVLVVAENEVPVFSRVECGATERWSLETGRAIDVVLEPADSASSAGASIVHPRIAAPIAQRIGRGRFRLRVSTKAAGIRLRVLLEHGDQQHFDLPLPPEGETEVVVPLEASRIVDGRVIDEQSGRPVARAAVWPEGDPGRFLVTDEEGRFRLVLARGGSPGGESFLGAQASGYLVAHITVPDDAATSPARPLEIRLSRARSVAGKVVDGEQRPLGGALVVARAGGYRRFLEEDGRALNVLERVATTNDEGAYVLRGIPDGEELEIVASLAGYTTEREPLPSPSPRAPDPVALDFELARRVRAVGFVVDSDDHPIPGARVSLTASLMGGDAMEQVMERRRELLPAAEGTADRNGRFSIADVEPGRYDLRAVAEGFAPARVPGVEVDGATEVGTVVLLPATVLWGLVQDRDANPIPGATVVAQSDSVLDDPFSRGVSHPISRDTTDDGGGFELSELPSDARLRLRVTKEGFAPSVLDSVSASSPEPLTIVLGPAAAIRGTVAGPSGERVASAVVTLEARNATRFEAPADSTRADEEGAFWFRDVTPGEWTLRIEAQPHQPATERVSLAEGDVAEIEVRLERGASVHGVVTDRLGAPVGGARVTARQAGDASRSPASADTSSDGRYRLLGLAPGELRLEARHPTHLDAIRDVDLSSEPLRVDFELEPGESLGGDVVSWDGSPVAGADVVARSMGEAQRATSIAARGRSDAAGGFLLEGLGPGSYELSASKAGFAPTVLPDPIAIDGGPVHGVRLVLGAGGAVEGLVSGVTFDELEGVKVFASSRSGQQNLLTQVDHAGQFRFDRLTPGRWAIAASSTARKQASTVVELREGDLLFVELELGGGLRLEGEVRSEGQPIAGAHVLVVGTNTVSRSAAVTSTAGDFLVTGLEAGEYLVTVLAGRMQPHEQTLSLEADDRIEIDLTGGLLSGIVVDEETGTPLTGVEVALHLRPASSTGVSSAGASSAGTSFMGLVGRAPRVESTDANGEFSFHQVPFGQIRLVASASGFATESAELVLSPSDPNVRRDLELTPSEEVEIRVTSEGAAVPRQIVVAVLDATGAAMTIESLPVDLDGTATLSALPGGPVRLLVSAPGHATATTMAPAAGSLTVSLPLAGSIRGIVTDLAESNEVAWVRLEDATGAPYRAIESGRVVDAWSVVKARFSIPLVPAGEWTVIVGGATPGAEWRDRIVVSPGYAVDCLPD